MDTKMIRLIAPLGTDEANFGTEKYRVDNDRTVLVPEEAALHLIEVGGFEFAPDDHKAVVVVEPLDPIHGARLTHSDPDASCSVGVKQPDGSFIVPHAHVAVLVGSHGFVPV